MDLYEFIDKYGALSDERFLATFSHPFLLREGLTHAEGARDRGRDVYWLSPPETVIGRGSDNDCVIPSNLVSTHHARLIAPEGGDSETWLLMDMESTNGTYLEGRRLRAREPVPIPPEAVIRLGTLRFSFLKPTQFLAIVRKLSVGVERDSEPETRIDPRINLDEDTTGWTRGPEADTDVCRTVGALRENALLDLLQDIEASQKTGVLEMWGEGISGRLSFRLGNPCQASVDGRDESGVQAIRTLLGIQQGCFQLLLEEAQIGERDIGLSFAEILFGISRKRSKEALQQSEDRLHAVLHNVLDGIVTFGEQEGIVSFNPAAQSIFGYSGDQVLGKRFTSLLPETVRAMVQDLLESGELPGTVRDLPGLRSDGTTFPMEVVVSQFTLGDQLLFTAAIRDVTKRKGAEEALKQSEAALRQSQKMEAIGRLAGAIAHDFNNMLTVIAGHGGILSSGLPSDHSLIGSAQGIVRATKRASDLTRQLLAFSRKQELKPKLLDLNRVTADVARMLDRLLADEFEVELRPADSLGLIMADEGQLEQILTNLVVNARDAMPGGGRLVISTRNSELTSEETRGFPAMKPGPCVELIVSDTGCGMSEEVLAHLFEPFFTTKPKGKGTGLGLSTVYGAVRNNSGCIRVESTEGEGTTFRVYFPTESKTRDADQPAAGASPEQSPTGGETILLVEDDPDVLALCRDGLSKYGYRILAATDGEEALALSKESSEVIHLLLTDVVMPNLNGPELAVRLERSREKTKVLYMSGYVDADLPETACLLQKPFSIETLARTVRAILDGEVLEGVRT